MMSIMSGEVRVFNLDVRQLLRLAQ
jgi:hypothetical protein